MEANIPELKKQFRVTLFETQILITTATNNIEAFESPTFTKYKIKIGEHDFIDMKENSLNYYECCGILLLFGITPPQYDELSRFLA